MNMNELINNMDKDKLVLNVCVLDFDKKECTKELLEATSILINAKDLVSLPKSILDSPSRIGVIYIEDFPSHNDWHNETVRKDFLNVCDTLLLSNLFKNVGLIGKVHPSFFSSAFTKYYAAITIDEYWFMLKDKYIYSIENTPTNDEAKVLRRFNPGLSGDFKLPFHALAPYSLYKSSLRKAELPQAITVGHHAFENSLIEEVYIPKARTVGNECFKDCEYLEILKMDSVDKIINPFENCGLKHLFLPETNITVYTELSDDVHVYKKTDDVEGIKIEYPSLDKIIENAETISEANKLAKVYEDYIR